MYIEIIRNLRDLASSLGYKIVYKENCQSLTIPEDKLVITKPVDELHELLHVITSQKGVDMRKFDSYEPTISFIEHCIKESCSGRFEK